MSAQNGNAVSCSSYESQSFIIFLLPFPPFPPMVYVCMYGVEADGGWEGGRKRRRQEKKEERREETRKERTSHAIALTFQFLFFIFFKAENLYVNQGKWMKKEQV